MKFLDEYARSGHVTHSAIAAGYSPRSAHVTGSRLLKDAKIQAALEKSRERAAKKLDLTHERVLKHLGAMSFTDVTDVVEWDDSGRVTLRASKELGAEVRAAIKSVRPTPDGNVVVEFVDKHAATVSLGRFLGMSTKEQLEIAGRGGAPIEHTDPEANKHRLSDRELARRLAFILTTERERVRQAHVIETDKGRGG